MEAGSSGLSVKKISRHVHNATNSLFHPVSFEEVYRYVQKYVRLHSQYSDSLLKKMGKGCYKINENNAESRQLLLNFKDEDEVVKAENIGRISLPLLGFEE